MAVSSRACAWRSALSCSAGEASIALRNNGFSSRTAACGACSMASARSSAVTSRCSRGTATDARPIATASCAPTNRPVAQISSARAYPTERTRGEVPREVGHEAQAGLTHGEGDVVGDHSQVAGQSQLEPGADRMTLHCGDRDRRHLRPDREAPLEPGDRLLQRASRARGQSRGPMAPPARPAGSACPGPGLRRTRAPRPGPRPPAPTGPDPHRPRPALTTGSAPGSCGAAGGPG